MAATANIRRSRQELEQLLQSVPPPPSLVPELTAAFHDPGPAREHPATRMIQEATAEQLADIRNIPTLTYTRFRDVQRYIDRSVYERPFFEKRTKLTLAAWQVLLGNDEYLNTLYDYIWSVCEETVWVLPQVERWPIELRAAHTVFDLAEIVAGLGPKLEDRLIQRIRAEIERRIFTPYLADPHSFWWYMGHNNWNGVCNGAIGAAFLLLEQNTKRLAHALEVVLAGLEVFLNTAFETDGGSGEGVGYWQYGMSNFICFAEMLRLRTEGAIDVLSEERVKTIAQFPARVMLSPGRYFAYSDCNEITPFDPGLIQRLVERTGEESLRDVLAEGAPLFTNQSRFHVLWRNVLWWDGSRPARPHITNAYLPVSAVVRLVAETRSGAPVVLAAKAGHNGVSHNHNDVGTFVLNVDGETLLCDPERGLYDNYLRFGHDQVIFSNSFGHSVPVIGGALQSRGAQFRGEITNYNVGNAESRVEMEIAGAYQVPDLKRAHRSLRLLTEGEKAGTLVLEDTFAFAGQPLPVEEAFVTWNNVLLAEGTALIIGEKHILQLSIESPSQAAFKLAVLKEESEANKKPVPLKRLSFTVSPSSQEVSARVKMTVLP